jgi:hypothetical protein
VKSLWRPCWPGGRAGMFQGEYLPNFSRYHAERVCGMRRRLDLSPALASNPPSNHQELSLALQKSYTCLRTDNMLR